MKPINGKTYPLWGKFVDGKHEWIGGTMIEHDRDCGDSPLEKITDIRMSPNGKDSAKFEVVGETFSWRSDVQYLGVGGDQPEKGLRLSSYRTSLDITPKPK